MPKPPGDLGYFDKVNYVIDAWAQPCEAPWYIYIETLKPALLEAFIVLITFGWDDVARGFFRPRGLNQRRTGKRKNKWGRRVPRFPELGELIGRNLPGAEEIKGEKWSKGGKALWRIDTVAQQALFWWLVADVTIDFAFNWTSVLYETRWCQESARGRFSWHKIQKDQHAANSWSNIPYREKDYQFPFPAWFGGAGNTGPNDATITCSVALEPVFPFLPVSGYETRIVDDDTGEEYGHDGPNDADDDGKGVSIVRAQVPNGRRFKAQVFSHGAWSNSTSGAIVGMED